MTIKELRDMNNLSQREFAEIIGVTQTAIYKWERKDVKININTQKKIDESFGLKRKSMRATSFDLGV